MDCITCLLSSDPSILVLLYKRPLDFIRMSILEKSTLRVL